MDDLVSIITPSYNTAKLISETIQSVIKQTYENWEMIIVDDCSTDNSIQIISSFNENRIKLLLNEKNSGAAVSRNRALREAKGRWVAFLDSDDLWAPDKLEKQIAFMTTQNCHFSYTQYEVIDEASTSLGLFVSGPAHITRTGMRLYCWPGCLTVMYDAEYVGLIQIADLKKNNDYAMWLKVSQKTDCYLLDEVLAQYRKRSGSISNLRYSELIRYHYLMWHKGDNRSQLVARLLTGGNLIFGVLKKLFYKKKSK